MGIPKTEQWYKIKYKKHARKHVEMPFLFQSQRKEKSEKLTLMGIK